MLPRCYTAALMFKRLRRISPTTAIFALVLLVPLPYVVVQELWPSDLTDRITCVALLAFLVIAGVAFARQSFRGRSLTDLENR